MEEVKHHRKKAKILSRYKRVLHIMLDKECCLVNKLCFEER